MSVMVISLAPVAVLPGFYADPVTPGRVHWGTGRPPLLGPIGAPCSSVRKTEWVGNCGHPSGESSHSSRRP